MEKFRASFAAGVDPNLAALLGDAQVGRVVAELSGVVTKPAWSTKPSWCLVVQAGFVAGDHGVDGAAGVERDQDAPDVGSAGAAVVVA
jgi:hypothetical protein